MTQPVYGCAVVLRLAGEVIGRGSSLGGPGVPPSTARIAEAAEAAWAEAERRLPVSGTGEVRAAKIAALRQDVLISLELSGPLIRIAAATYGDLDATLQPGMDGLAALMEGKVGSTFPGAAAAGSVTPGDSARRAVSDVVKMVRGEAGGGGVVSLTEPGELEKKHGITLFRFRTTHVAQWRSDKGPELLYRGQKLVLLQDIDEVSELWHLADRLAGNLVNRLATEPSGGSVALGTGIVEAPDAFSLALAREALLEFWSKRTDSGKVRLGPDDPTGVLAERAVEAAQSYLSAARAQIKRAEDRDKLAASAVIARNRDSKSAAEPGLLADRFEKGLLKPGVTAGLRGLVIWGNSDWPREVSAAPSEKGTDPWSFHPSEPAVRKLMAETAVAALPGEMPWLGWTDLDVDRFLKRPAGQKSASALREMRKLVWQHQQQAVDAGPDGQDMVGGIVVPGSSSPLPTWQTARLVAFLGTMLGEPELTPKGERGGEIVKLLGAARFLRQLQVDDALEWMCKDPTVVKGGLRNAVWDQRTQTDATAMGLLAVLEIIGGIEKASGEGK